MEKDGEREGEAAGVITPRKAGRERERERERERSAAAWSLFVPETLWRWPRLILMSVQTAPMGPSRHGL